ncbi:MAG: hypothetical protein PVJ76_11065 [Gemmatimonadota bacterium]|jgi:hypothetical protein
MMSFRRWLGEIHRRAIWQTLGVYLAGAWVVLQVVDIVVDSLDLPRWIPVGVILLILAGLPITLVTAYLQAGRESGADGPRKGAEQDVPTAPSDPGGGPSGFVSAGRLFTWKNAVAGGILAFALWGMAAAGWMILAGGGRQANADLVPGVDRGVVAVLPFRVAGAANLEFLAEGMVDLLATKLTGEGGLRAADPRSVFSAWRGMSGRDGDLIEREAAMRLARSLGAGQVLIGGIVGTPGGMVVSATVMDVDEGNREIHASAEGPLDSLSAVVDQLTVRLLALEADEEDQRLAALTSTSLQGLRAYLDGQAAYRRGRYSEANRHFQRALDSDSTFALAALAQVSSAWWSPGYDAFNRARALAWKLRDGLSDRDRALLDAWTGPRYPLASGWAEHLVRWELAIAAAPERPESWYESGDIYFHYGPLLGISDWMQRAEARFRRAFQLDPTFAAPVGHLLELSAIRRDPEETEFYLRTYATVDSAGDTSSFLQWRGASALGDSGKVAEIEGRFSDLDGSSLNRIIGLAQLYDPTLRSAERAASILAERAGTLTERKEWLLGLHSLALNRGRPQEALALIQEWAEVEGSPGEALRIRLLDGLFWGGDQDAARDAAERLAAGLDTLSAEETDLSDAQLADICVSEIWRLSNGDTKTALASLARFRERADQTRLESLPLHHAVCAAAIEALLAMEDSLPHTEEAVERLDRLLLLVPDVSTGDDVSLVGPLIVAKWRERNGDLEGALAAVRRWHNHWFTGVRYLSTYLRERGRLASLAGEREEAIRAFRHYLVLRGSPEPEWMEERDWVRARLMELLEAPPDS